MSRCFDCGGECSFSEVDAATAKHYREMRAISDAGEDDDSEFELNDPGDSESAIPREHKIGKNENRTPLVRLATGEESIDFVTGGGYVGSKLYGLVGPEGTGKSRFALRSACQLCKTGHVVYTSTSGEEGADDIERHVLDARLDKLPYVKSRLHYYDECDDPDFICSLLDKHDATFLVLDSISTLYNERVPGNRGDAGQINYAIYRFRKAMKTRKNSAMLALFQRTQDGKLAGGSKPAYLFDTMLETTRMAWVSPTRAFSYDEDGGRTTREVAGKFVPTEEPSEFFRLRPTGKTRHAPPTNIQMFRLTKHSIEPVKEGGSHAQPKAKAKKKRE